MGQREGLGVVLLRLVLDDGVAEVYVLQFLSILCVLAHNVINEALLLPSEVVFEECLRECLVFDG